MKAKIISSTRLAQVLGKGNSKQSIISSAAVVFTSFFYVFTIASYFRVPIYFLHSRVVTKLYFTDVYIISKYVDHILIIAGIVLWLIFSIRANKARFAAAIIYGGISIAGILTGRVILVDFAAIISIPLVICFLIYDKITSASRKILNTDTNLYVNYYSILGIAIGIVSLIILSALPLFSISSTPIPNYGYAIFVLFSSFSPVLMIMLINVLPIKLLTMEFLRIISKILKHEDHVVRKRLLLTVPHKRIKIRNKVIYLSIIVLLTFMLVAIPHQATINKNNRLIGVDSRKYVTWENTLTKSNDAQDFIRKAFVTLSGGDRPITLIFFFTVIKVTADEPTSVIDNIPIILGPALVLIIYFLTRELTSNDNASLFAAFLTAVSFHTLVGLYAGFYANWFALIIGYLAFVFIFRFLKSSKKLNLIIYFFMTMLVLFSHTYTWTILTMVTGVFLLIMLGFNYYPRRNIIFLLMVVLCSVGVAVAKTSLTRSAGGIEQDLATARSQEFGVGQLPVRWNNLIDTTEIYYGAAFSNVIILLLGMYWLFRSDIRDPSSIFIIIFLSIGIFPLFFGNWLIQSRLFYNIPFQIPAAIALAHIQKEAKGMMVLIPVCIWLIAMCIRTISNFY